MVTPTSLRRADDLAQIVLQRGHLAPQRGQRLSRLSQTVAGHSPRRDHPFEYPVPVGAPFDQQAGRLQVHQLRREAVREYVVDLPRDPGALRERPRLRFGRACGSLLGEEPLALPRASASSRRTYPASARPMLVTVVVSKESSSTTAYEPRATTLMGSAADSGILSRAVIAHPHHRTSAGTRNPAA